MSEDDNKKIVDFTKVREAASVQKQSDQDARSDNELNKHLETARREPVVPHEPSKSLIDFPTDWKSVVREIIEIYCEQQSKGEKKLGFTKLRDQIMEREDKVENGKRVRDTVLTRQDLQNWILYGKVLSNPKFWFVDKFVRKLQVTDHKVIEKMHSFVERKHVDVLSHIFQTQHRRHRDEMVQLAKLASNKVLVSKILPSDQDALFRVDHGRGEISDIRQMGIFIHEPTSSIHNVALIYPKNPMTVANAEKALRDAVVKFGYLVPQYESSPGYLAGTIITWSEDEFSSKQKTFADFQFSKFSLDFEKACMFIKAAHSSDDPLGWSSEIKWKQTGSKFSPFATELSDDYADYDTKLVNLDVSNDLLKYLKSLKNRYLIW